MAISPALYEVAGVLKLLLGLTAGMFGLAQYYDARQKHYIKDSKETVQGMNLKEHIKTEKSREFRENWENILNAHPVNNQVIITFLWFISMGYVLIVAFNLFNEMYNFRKNFLIDIELTLTALTLASWALVGLGVWLSVQLFRMRGQRATIDKDIERLAIFSKACEINSS